MFKKKARLFILIITFAISVFILGLSLAVCSGIYSKIIPELKKSFPENQFVLSPLNLDLAFLKFNTSSLNDVVVERIRKIDEIEGVYPILSLKMPVSASGDILGNEMSTDLSVNGVDEGLVKDEVWNGYKFSAENTEYLPVLISRYFVDLYNLGIAESNGLPKLSDTAIMGQVFDLNLGDSVALGTGNTEKSKTIRCQVVGLTSNTALLAVVAPIKKIEEYNKWYNANEAVKYSRILIRTSSIDAIHQLETLSKELNFSISSDKDTLRQFMFAARLIIAVIFSFTTFVLILSMMVLSNYYSLMLLERKFEIGLFRALGCTPFQALTMYMSEGIIVGIISGLIGSLCLLFTVTRLNSLIKSFFSGFTFIPDNILYLPIWLVCTIILISIILCLISVFPIIYRYIHSKPAVLLKKD